MFDINEMLFTSDNIVDIISKKLIGQLKPISEISFNLSDINNGVASRIKYTNVNGYDIYYEDVNHVYYIIKDGIQLPLISVTTLIGVFNLPFNTEEMAINCANKSQYDCNCLDVTNWDTISIDERIIRIKKAWEENNKIATEYGTAVHMACEYLANNLNMDLNQILDIVVGRCGEVLKDRELVYKYLVDFRKLLIKYVNDGYEIITEPVVVDLLLGCAGQTDLVLINHKTKKIKVLDHKTNGENPVEEKAYNKMRGIFSHVDSQAFNHYSIQIPYYATMLKNMYKGYDIEEMYLLWFNEQDEGFRRIDVDGYIWFPEIEKMRNFFKDREISKRIYENIKKSITN